MTPNTSLDGFSQNFWRPVPNGQVPAQPRPQKSSSYTAGATLSPLRRPLDYLAERLFPRPPRRGLRVLRRAVLEEIRVLDGVQHLVHPGQRVLRVLAVDGLEAELGQAAVGDEADV